MPHETGKPAGLAEPCWVSRAAMRGQRCVGTGPSKLEHDSDLSGCSLARPGPAESESESRSSELHDSLGSALII
jgi:hypothetical protein